MKANLLTCLLLFLCSTVYAQVSGEVISLGVPYVQQDEIYQDLFIKDAGTKVVSITIACFDVTKEHDSTQVYLLKAGATKSKKKKVYYSSVHIDTKDEGAKFQPLYKKILLKNHNLPVGVYHTYLTVQLKGDHVINKMFVYHIDSLLHTSSPTNKQFDNAYNPKVKSFLGAIVSRQTAPSGLSNARSAIKKSAREINKSLNANGFSVSYREVGTKTFADVYCQEKYVGYYEINMKEPLAGNIEKRRKQLGGNITTGVSSSLDNNQTVFSQVKKLYSESNKSEAVGNISITGNAANGQEEYSENQNNYYEIAGNIEVPIMDIPVSLEGYYTSQDAGRVAKASYFRFHYDSDKAKAKLLSLISGYNNKYNEALATGKGMEMVYGTYLNKLQEDKDKLWADMAGESGIADIGKFKLDTSGLQKELTSSYKKKLTDSLSQATSKKDDAMQQYEKTMDKYKQIQELEKKAQSYRTLLDQYRSNNYFDSVMAYDKLKDINSGSLEDKSYKELAKSASGFLPEGEASKFITGLTSLDAGIFSKQISSYTLNGQTIKGLDAGYDLGFCQTGFTYGRVEYVGRDGTLDKYNGYSVRASFKSAEKQKTSLVYYGYMPSRKMLKENAFFDKIDGYMPSFKAPIHIVSVMHIGAITKHTNVEVEAATSFRDRNEFKRDDMKLANKMAYRLSVEENIPQTTIDFKGEYEHVGTQFENNTLPLTLSGTDRYSAGAKGSFLNNFLTMGIEYNYLQQKNFASKSNNTKWGFEIKTTSKRYPSVSVSYKPFTTFRSVADTFNIPQRPILGAVWLGKMSYQIKKKSYTLRLTAIYNKNTALVDTMESNSNIVQFNALYTNKKINLMFNAGQTQVKATQLSPVHGKTNFLTIAAGYIINQQWNINLGQDIGMMKTGLSRYAANIGAGYRFSKIPLSLQGSVRYNTYRTVEGQVWKNIYSAMLDMNWQFRFKTNEK